MLDHPYQASRLVDVIEQELPHLQPGHVVPRHGRAAQLSHDFLAGDLAAAHAMPHQPAQLQGALALQPGEPGLVLHRLAQVLAERGHPLLAAELIQRCHQGNCSNVMHALEGVEVGHGRGVSPGLVRGQQEVLKRPLQRRR